MTTWPSRQRRDACDRAPSTRENKPALQLFHAGLIAPCEMRDRVIDLPLPADSYGSVHAVAIARKLEQRVEPCELCAVISEMGRIIANPLPSPRYACVKWTRPLGYRQHA